MRWITPRPILLGLTLMLVIGAIAAIELRVGTPGANSADVRARADERSEDVSRSAGKTKDETGVSGEAKEQPASDDTERSGAPDRDASEKPKNAVSDAKRLANKDGIYEQAKEITGSAGLINTDGVSIKEAAGEKVVLIEFWTYTCFNCQNAQPHINSLYEKYRDDGLQVVGVHTPEFGFEKDISNVREAVGQANIKYPVVLDNHYATWNAYGQRFWPAWYLIDADGFIRYRHFGEGAYDETEKKVQELLAERDRVY